MIIVKVKKIDEKAVVPTKANNNDAGWDLYSIENVVLHPGERKTVRTGIQLQIPDGYVGLIWPRSGLSVKFGVDILAGVIDAGYRGEIMVCLQNTDINHKLTLTEGAKIAQILIQEIPLTYMVEADELSESDRGEKGFGSSG